MNQLKRTPSPLAYTNRLNFSTLLVYIGATPFALDGPSGAGGIIARVEVQRRGYTQDYHSQEHTIEKSKRGTGHSECRTYMVYAQGDQPERLSARCFGFFGSTSPIAGFIGSTNTRPTPMYSAYTFSRRPLSASLSKLHRFRPQIPTERPPPPVILCGT